MKNQGKGTLKKAIFFGDIEDFKEITRSLGFDFDIEYDGLDWYDITEEDEDFCDYDVTDALSEYFGVKVTSVHADDCEYPGIWVIYKEE